MPLPPPPTNDQTGSFAWLEWFRTLRNYITQTGSVPWGIINFAGSSITDIASRSHQNLQSLQGGTTGQYYHLTQADHTGTGTGVVVRKDSPTVTGTFTNTGSTVLGDSTSDTTTISGNIILPKTSGYGIKVDTSSPTYGWKDLLGSVIPKTTGVGSPTLTAFRGGNVRNYAFAAGEDYDGSFHIPHDWAPGTDLYFHVHWGHNGTAISGSLVLNWYFTYSKGHNQANFPAEINVTQTISTPDIATIPQYRHRIEEFQLTAASPSASQIDTDDIEVDGVLMFHMDATTIPTITGGTPNKPFIFFIDLHYQTTNMPTKAKAPNFYA